MNAGETVRDREIGQNNKQTSYFQRNRQQLAPLMSFAMQKSKSLRNRKRRTSHSNALPTKRKKQTDQPICSDLSKPRKHGTGMTNVMGSFCFDNAISSWNLLVQEASYMTYILDGIAQSLEDHMASPAIVLNGIRALGESKFATAPNVTRYTESIIRAMRRHSHILVIQEEGCFALRLLLESHPGAVARGRDDRIAQLLETIHDHSDSKVLRYIGLDIIRVLVQFSSEQRANIGTHLIRILKLLKENLDEYWLQQVGLSLISWIVEEDASRKVLVESEGVLYALQVMQQHPDCPIIQCNSSAVLCWCLHKSTADVRSMFDSRPESTLTILQMMRRFLSNSLIFGNGACILSGLIIANPDRNDLDKGDLIKLSFYGLELHQSSSKVQRNCLTLLRIATNSNQDYNIQQDFVIDNIEVVMKTMEAYGDDGDLQAEGCGFLGNLMSHYAAAKERISALGCIETVVKCQVKHKKNANVQQQALRFHSLLLEASLVARSEAPSAFGGGNHDVLDTMIIADQTLGIFY
eukprot:scaffold10472_cov126-Cylindrotheca_fusiformis.AAC.16